MALFLCIICFAVCEYKHACYDIGSSWADKDDCVTVRCLRDPGTGNAIVDTYPYGYYSIAYLFLYQMSPNKSELERFARFAMYFAYV